MKSRAIGLTGGISSGKSLAGAYLSQWYKVVDSDQMVHDLYRTDAILIERIRAAFGDGCVKSDGVHRKALRQIVFSDKSRLEDLNQIVRPRTSEKLLQLIQQCKDEATTAIFLIPLLFENHWQTHLDHVLLLGCSEDTQIQRVMERDSCSREEALSIVRAQMPLELKRDLCDYYILNEGEPGELYHSLDLWRSKVLDRP